MKISENLIETVTVLLVLASIIWFLFQFFEPNLVFSDTHIGAGDTVGHYYAMYYLNKALLPAGQIIGWCPNWFMGYPMFQFYFPAVFTIGAVLGYIPGITLAVAFKIITVLGVFLLPICAYICFRLMKFEFPIPLIAALFMLPQLFMENYSMWGGNIPSALAGEFAYLFSMSLMLVFIGSLYRGIETKKHIVLNAVIFGIMVISHIFPAMFAAGISLFFLLDRKNFRVNFIYLAKVFCLGLALCSFWFVPMAMKSSFTVPHMWYLPDTIQETWKMIFESEAGKFFPLPVFAVIGIIGFALGARKKDNKILFLGFCAAMAFVGIFVSGTLSETGITVFRQLQFIKFISIMYMFLFLLAATAFIFTSKLRARFLVPIIAALLIGLYVSGGTTYIKYWIEWNYSGYEARPLWNDYKNANEFLSKNGTGRVVFEYDPGKYESGLGSSRATETIPAFSDRPITEGTHFQSAFSGPYIYYAHCEYSSGCSCLFGPETGGCSGFDLDSATKHLELFNVKQLFVSSDKLKNALRNDSRYEMTYGPGTFEIWELKNQNSRYVTISKYQPVFMGTKNWRNISYAWYKNYDYIDIPIIFDDSAKNKFAFSGNYYDMSEMPRIPVDQNCEISESISKDELLINTTCIGKPLLVKISYYPNWQVDGADKIYLVSPSFMMIYPNQQHVRLYYGWTISDIIGNLLTILGIAVIAVHIIGKHGKNKILKKIDNMLALP